MRKIKPTKFDAISELVTGAFGSDDNAEEVVRDLMTELASSLMTSIRDLTRFDRVDRR